MFKLQSAARVQELESMLQAIGKAQAVIEFNVDGTIITANENFLNAVGYRLEEIKGRHHSMFCDEQTRNSPEYQQFWANLREGRFQAAEYRRVGNGGREIWIQASYNPIFDKSGKPFKIVKFATDITKQKLQNADFQGQIEAIGKSQAVISFNLDGTVINANQNFLNTLGYTLSEIQGRHHSMFVDPAYKESAEYRAFWEALRRGEYQAAEYKRFGKGGKEVWIQASYNPIFDMNGKPFKVVKFATDITAQKLQNADYSGQLDAIGKAQAVIEFNLDGTIRAANPNFLHTLGYSLSEIQGRHHSMFVEPAEREGADYRAFWEALRRGEYQTGEYKRIAKGGREIYIQASYNPIFDLNGKPYKVVKYASDVTAQVVARKRSEYVRTMMEQVASGAEELNASVREIAQSMIKSRDTTNTVADQVESADKATQRLSTAAQAMGGIVEMISEITGQINLLALNATIESARAGEAGRGFAVVANEVKNLANQAKNATEQITNEINSMRGVSTEVVGALTEIKRSIEQVREYVTSTATAVEEQSAVTNDMSSNMQRAAKEASAIGGG